jgi:hypothetical protein
MNQMDALMRAQAQARFDAARAGLPQEFYSPEMSMAAQPNMSPVNPMEPAGSAQQQAPQYQNPLANYQGLAPMQHNVADIQRGGGIIQPLQVQMTPPGTGMAGGQGNKKDSASGLLEMLAKAIAGGTA